ncbi:ABC transporter ATP-binding protein [Wenxinia saemankumensis]|uniref:ABC-type dipeptide/oligopeptide/nickel transport system, ATPase component n=1 Tax=Wenxinia saemankumensis TaxID=1447782 RepID=A0A1M6I165_9RHOB|nr:ABC transporter ATP-binding protein [Wenxinia saemankumensis]SHJ28229.1 ABC-type dipeptide/oligopeptide/nickel transport system, ATPase component [Wenxinia saemankumensis]
MTALLDIRDLRLGFRTLAGQIDVLHGIDLAIRAGEQVALVGESGSGKSVTARIILGLLQETRSARVSGRVGFDGRDVMMMSPKERAALRGIEMSMIFQDPTSSLNPTFTIERQFAEVMRRPDRKLTRAACRERAARMLDEVSIPDTGRVLDAYPFQLSGGMNQRVMIAMALANNPKLLLADEPGTALDVSVQAQTLDLMRDLVTRHGTSVLFISHNMGVVREFADRIYVIYRGRIVEEGPTPAVFADPGHAYTRALLKAVPRITGRGLPDVPEVSDDFFDPMVRHGGTS